MKPGITLLGLGPGNPDLLTRQAWKLLEDSAEIFLLTSEHPTVANFPPGLKVRSFDHLFQGKEGLAEITAQIVDQVLALGQRPEGVIYAVPGHPFIADATVPEIARQASLIGLPVQVIEGLSFLDVTCAALGIDPLPKISLVAASELLKTHVPSFPPDAPALIAQLSSAEAATEVKRVLLHTYPEDHPVKLVHNAGSPDCRVEDFRLAGIDHSTFIGVLTTLYVPPVGPATSFEGFQEVIAHLRAPDGCPWDREQTHYSLRPYLLEETYEVLTALDEDDPDALREELGDLLLQIVLHAQIAYEHGEFRMAEVIHHIHTKLVRRHPHVFADVEVEGADHVLRNWEALKAQERKDKGKEKKSALDGIPPALPALSQAQEYQSRAARFGFEWPGLHDVVNKVLEEFEEVQQAEDGPQRIEEIGDLLSTVTNLARFYGVDAESALRQANLRFRQRFGYIEAQAASQGRKLAELSLEEMLALWEEAKQEL